MEVEEENYIVRGVDGQLDVVKKAGLVRGIQMSQNSRSYSVIGHSSYKNYNHI